VAPISGPLGTGLLEDALAAVGTNPSLVPGAIIHLAMQVNGRPAETRFLVRNEIKELTRKGFLVVEAAGNGGHDLDSFIDAAGQRVLDRKSADFDDTGAVIVTAAS